jgi:predicted kinase
MKVKRIQQPVLYLLLGLPGSGKSTFAGRMARDARTVVVSRDQIRMALKLRYCFDMAYEEMVASLADTMLEECLGRGFNVVMDETHIQQIRRMAVTEIALRVCPKVRIVYVGFTAGNCLKNRLKNDRGYKKKDWERIIANMDRGKNPIDTKFEHLHEFWLTKDAGRHCRKGIKLAKHFWASTLSKQA